MKDTAILALLLALNGLTCTLSYLIGQKAGMHKGWLNGRASRVGKA